MLLGREVGPDAPMQAAKHWYACGLPAYVKPFLWLLQHDWEDGKAHKRPHDQVSSSCASVSGYKVGPDAPVQAARQWGPCASAAHVQSVQLSASAACLGGQAHDKISSSRPIISELLLSPGSSWSGRACVSSYALVCLCFGCTHGVCPLPAFCSRLGETMISQSAAQSGQLRKCNLFSCSALLCSACSSSGCTCASVAPPRTEELESFQDPRAVRRQSSTASCCRNWAQTARMRASA